MHESKGSFSFSRVKLLPSQQIGLHRQSSWELSYIVSGSGTRQIGDCTESFSRGEVVLIPPEIPHCWYFDSIDVDSEGRIENITVTFRNDLLDKCAETFPELEEVVVSLKEIHSAIRVDSRKSGRIVHILENMEGQNSAERVASLIDIFTVLSASGNDLSAGTRQEENQEQLRIDNIRTFIICNATRDISLDDISRYVGMNKSSFCVFCKKAFAKTFVEYLNSYRISLACQMLSKSSMTVSEICFQCGFNGVPYFSRVFRKIQGVSPTRFREMSTGTSLHHGLAQ